MTDLATIQPKVSQSCPHRHPGRKAWQSIKQVGHISAYFAVIIQNAQLWQAMPAANLQVHRVVSRCDLHRSWEIRAMAEK